VQPSDASCDYETKSGTDIKLGLARYFADPEADVLCLAYRLPGGEPKLWVAGEDPNPFDLFEHIQAGGRLRGWNCAFEWHAWNLLCVPKYGWPPLPIEQCVDTMAQAQAMNLPGALEKCGLALGVSPDKQKSQAGKLLIRKLCVPQKLTKNQPLRWLTAQTHPELHSQLHAYAMQDVVAEESIARKLRRLSEFEQTIWVITQRINQRGIPVAIDEVDNIHHVLTAEKEQLNRELRALTGRQVSAATNRGALLTWINAHPEMQGYDPVFFEDEEEEVEDHHGDYFANLKKDTVTKALKRDHLPADVRRVLEIRQQVCQTSTAKFPKLLKIAADDDTLKGLFVYHGAGTGRWASRGGFNVQNLPRPTLKGVGIDTALESLGHLDWDACSLLWDSQLMEAGVNCLRGVIKAPEGYEFIDADLASVENRVASWIAGQDDKLEMFAAGLDEYKTFGSWFFSVPYEEVTGKQRQDMKPVILGGIFGLGGDGLVDYAEKMGVTMTRDVAHEAIAALREDYHRIKSCWYACQAAAIQAVEAPGHWFEAGKLSFICHKDFLWMKLPSGRPIAWARPIVKMFECPWTENVSVGYDDNGNEVFEDRPAWRKGVSVESVDTFTRQWCRHQLIGSSMFQSGVQGTARDILAQGAVNVEEAMQREGLLQDPHAGVVFMAHDELMALVPVGSFDHNRFGELMCKRAPWFLDLPLAFEAWKGPRFRK
jgi:DNA polymerase bacteriophage-type